MSHLLNQIHNSTKTPKTLIIKIAFETKHYSITSMIRQCGTYVDFEKPLFLKTFFLKTAIVFHAVGFQYKRIIVLNYLQIPLLLNSRPHVVQNKHFIFLLLNWHLVKKFISSANFEDTLVTHLVVYVRWQF